MEVAGQLSKEGKSAAVIQELLSKKILVSGLAYQGPVPLTTKRKNPEKSAVAEDSATNLENGISENMNKINIACQKLKASFEFQEEKLVNGTYKTILNIGRLLSGEGIDQNRKSVITGTTRKIGEIQIHSDHPATIVREIWT